MFLIPQNSGGEPGKNSSLIRLLSTTRLLGPFYSSLTSVSGIIDPSRNLCTHIIRKFAFDCDSAHATRRLNSFLISSMSVLRLETHPLLGVQLPDRKFIHFSELKQTCLLALQSPVSIKNRDGDYLICRFSGDRIARKPSPTHSRKKNVHCKSFDV